MLAAVAQAKSVTESETGTDAGLTLTFTGTVFLPSGNSNATISARSKAGTFDIADISVGKTCYTKQSPNSWEGFGYSAKVAKQMSEVWVSAPVGSAIAAPGSANSTTCGDSGTNEYLGLFPFLVAGKAAQPATLKGAFAKGSTSTVDGQAAVSLVSATEGTISIATAGEDAGYPIEYTLTSSSEGAARFSFSDWNQGTEPSVPSDVKLASSFR
jgi:hypothetical protein